MSRPDVKSTENLPVATGLNHCRSQLARRFSRQNSYFEKILRWVRKNATISRRDRCQSQKLASINPAAVVNAVEKITPCIRTQIQPKL
jgi:hypothetical protein